MSSNDNLTTPTPCAGHHSAVEIAIEILDSDCYSDLIKQRRAGKPYRPARGKTRAIAVSYKDLILLPVYENVGLGPVGKAIDLQIGGNLSETIAAEGLSGKQGESLTINLESAGLGSGNARRITVIGMGQRSACGQFSYCGLAGALISKAQLHLDENVILPVQDLFDTEDKDSVTHFVRVLSCRLEHHLNTSIEHGLLKRVRLLVASSSNDAARAGLASYSKQLCSVCSDPNL